MLLAIPGPHGAAACPVAHPKALMLQMSPKEHKVKYIRLGIRVKNKRCGRALCLTQTCSLSHEMSDDVLTGGDVPKESTADIMQTDWETAMMGWHPEALGCGKAGQRGQVSACGRKGIVLCP